MKIIDAHLHFCLSNPYFDRIAQNAGHENTDQHLRLTFEACQVVHGVVMGNRNFEEEPFYPPYLSYLVGLDSHTFPNDPDRDILGQAENHLRKKQCAGIKLYPGYNQTYVNDPVYDPFYDLAQTYQKTIAIHTGVTAGPNAMLKYCHPLTVDEVAVRFPRLSFVMCHFGNPWLCDTAAVLEKNSNVYADLSGLLEGMLDIQQYFKVQSGYVEQLKTWIAYTDRYDSLMYGTDWPLVNIPDYMEFIARLIPEKYFDDVFYNNANQIYHLRLEEL